MGTGTDAAIEASDLTLVRGDLRWPPTPSGCPQDVVTIKGNLFWAFAYNVAALPLARWACSTRCSPALEHDPVLGVPPHSTRENARLALLAGRTNASAPSGGPPGARPAR